MSGYSPALSVGDFRLLPGQLRSPARGLLRLIPKRARLRTMWREWPIKLESDFIIKRKLKASLEGSRRKPRHGGQGASVFGATARTFPPSTRSGCRISIIPPATTIIATTSPGFAISDLRIEINTISLATKGKTKRKVIRGPRTAAVRRLGFRGEVLAISCSCPALWHSKADG